jgi:hypothetical protein
MLLADSERQPFVERAQSLKQEHLAQNPGYKYSPKRKDRRQRLAPPARAYYTDSVPRVVFQTMNDNSYSTTEAAFASSAMFAARGFAASPSSASSFACDFDTADLAALSDLLPAADTYELLDIQDLSSCGSSPFSDLSCAQNTPPLDFEACLALPSWDSPPRAAQRPTLTSAPTSALQSHMLGSLVTESIALGAESAWQLDEWTW